MRIDIRPRGGGKTLSLIRESEVMQIPIVCANHNEVNRIMGIAKDLGYDIPNPIAMAQLDKLRGLTHQCLVDNADWILESFLGVNVLKATFTEEIPRIKRTF